MSDFTPGPWQWTSSDAGDVDEYGCKVGGPIDMDTWKSTGYCGNPELKAAHGDEQTVLSAGGGEYCPVHGASPEEMRANARLIASAPDLLAALEDAEFLLRKCGTNWREAGAMSQSMLRSAEDARAAIAKAKGTDNGTH